MIGALSVVLASCARIPTPQEANDAVLALRNHGSWAWALGIVLIWADQLLPIPQTAVIAALGIIYGTLVGGLLGSLGLITGGLFGYGLMLTPRGASHDASLGAGLCTRWRVCSTGGVLGRSSSPAAFPTASRRPWSFSLGLRACR
jgi:hypothetical protein